MTKKAVIFLDIDGVLLPFPPKPTTTTTEESLFPKSNLAALRRLWEVTNPSDTQWILSSTWRVREEYIHDIVHALQEFGMENFVFDGITDPTLHSERQWEIFDWLERKSKRQQQQPQHPQQYQHIWLALDDEDLIHGETNAKHKDLFDGHVVQTQSNVGLTMSDVDLAISLWKEQKDQQLLQQQGTGKRN